MSDQKGLFRKYTITKADGSPTDRDAEYFVLRLDKDKHARKAVMAYADSVESENPVFAKDLRYWVQYGFLGGERDSNDNYQCVCCHCGKVFIGHKRRVACDDCKKKEGE